MDAPVPSPFHTSSGAPLRWGAEDIWQQLQPLLPGVSVEVVARTDSTNTRLIERARAQAGQRDAPVSRPGELRDVGDVPRAPYGRRAGDTEPCLLVAEHQTGGRGRLGRDWQGSAGASLTFSLALPLAPRDWSGLSLAVGVALAEALDIAPPRIGLKWPNDLWILDGPGRGRKLGGILIETVPVNQRRMCIVGVGLNVLPQPAEGLTHGYACLQELDGDTSAPRALAAVAAPLVRALQRFEAEGFAAFQAGFERRDLLAGLPVTTTGAEPLHGVAEGVDERGALRVRAGTLHTLVSGEVSVRLRDDAC
ncbi:MULTISPECIES: biotin--[acetyl-CoA-carboxylase] ligase [unclassified Rubrivivax]|uniref:biotin--[acetyl-CoA-carboxylase] ligase n=1 Tax=unclassified Rubrivivax TaxID=2649762 RepID=UPI001E546C18|nr:MULTISPECIES: biotin--[acetyl-CoA-carboxylase] ligase [unclassified Rubrivivax]MCC9596531.1 biotin--[acetyl-CoA-carboxylase] ligase [Rubrivivax sp. JA1055]MCC9648687.1 biotin--[acetyl-CoA-carboxylase] ligase [Rubrivivax sp. JA1029]